MNYSNCTFSYNNKEYIVGVTSTEIYKNDKAIKLPDNTTLAVTSWLESFPPKIHKLEPVVYRGYVDYYLAIELLK